MTARQAATCRQLCGSPTQGSQGRTSKADPSPFAGVLQADGYAGFHHLDEGGRIVEAACWAHVRRKFDDIHVAHGSAIANEVIQRIGIVLRYRARDSWPGR